MATDLIKLTPAQQFIQGVDLSEPQKLVRAKRLAAAQELIPDIGSLRRHLQTALELEHATIPAYLTALYSIKDGTNAESAEIIQSVVMEEMLHMTLVANVLNAVGGKPRINSPGFIPQYPGPLPHSSGALQVGLMPFSREAIDTYCQIEKPAPPGAKPQFDRYDTIGQFYEALQLVMVELERQAKPNTIFTGDPARQIQPHHAYYGGGGEVIAVEGLKAALEALEEITDQGEGLPHDIHDGDEKFGDEQELAHYFRFMQIAEGRYYTADDTPRSGPTGSAFPVDWTAAWNMSPNPKMERYKGRPEVEEIMADFNRGYTQLLGGLHKAFNGEPDQLQIAVPSMYRLKYLAQALMRIPTGVGDTTVGPSFEYDDN